MNPSKSAKVRKWDMYVVWETIDLPGCIVGLAHCGNIRHGLGKLDGIGVEF